MLEEKFVALFATPETFDSVMLGFDLALVFIVLVVSVLCFFTILMDIFYPWLKRKVLKSKGGEK